MTFIFYLIAGYLLFKLYKYFKILDASINTNKKEPKVHQTTKSKRKINDKDIIDAKFEEIDVKENPSSE
jgi:hypothetical protein